MYKNSSKWVLEQGEGKHQSHPKKQDKVIHALTQQTPCITMTVECLSILVPFSEDPLNCLECRGRVSII